ncbi:MAG: hypothetical protein NZ553_13830 [Caldilinea sp.]|nr:hypothetical protein [Caldilinea sp.]MDW8441552.1 hypothetical protein [Caldilineaceae bacterium]
MNGNRGFDTQGCRERSRQMRAVRMRLIAYIEQVYCHRQFFNLLYRDLAAIAVEPHKRNLLLHLADLEQQGMDRCVRALRRLQRQVPEACDNALQRTWRRILVLAGPRLALTWIDHIKRTDMQRRVDLLRRLKVMKMFKA